MNQLLIGMYSFIFVSKICNDSGTKVVQVGEGSDEQFCGYKNYMEYLRMFKITGYIKKFVPNLGQKIISKAATSIANLNQNIWFIVTL